jgi:hypothetical protein
LGIVQVPLGLTLYGSPQYLFILYAVWMGFLLLLYFILDYRDDGRREFVRDGVSYAGGESSRVTESKSGRGFGWLGPLAAGAGAMALFRGRKKNRDAERALSRTPSPTGRSHHGREPTVISSRRASESYYDEKHSERRRASGGGFMNKLFAAGAGLGAGALVSKMMNRRSGRHDDEYSAVATDTPSRARRYGPASEITESTDYTERTEDVRRHPSTHDRQSSILPAPRPGAAGDRPRPMTPQRSHAATSRLDSTVDTSDYSSYVSPSRAAPERRRSGGAGKGFLAGIGLGFLAKMGKDRRDRREEERLRDEEERRREEEEDRRAGKRSSRYTGDGYPSPSRRESRRRPHRPRPPPSAVTTTVSSMMSGESSIEPRGDTPYEPAPPGGRIPPGPVPVPGAPPVPVANTGGPSAAPLPVPVPMPAGGASAPHSRYDVTEPVAMPPMPVDPQGILRRDSDSDHRRRREGEVAAAAAVSTASALAAREEEERRRRGERVRDSPQTNPPVSVRVHVHDNPDRNITLRKLTEEEARREQQRRRRRNDSVSSISGGESTPRRYRRDSSSQRRAETAAEQEVERDNEPIAPLSPPNPAFARGSRQKDSAYYSQGQPGPSGAMPAAGATVSSLGSPAGITSPGGSHATFTSGPITDMAADRRRRRRLERREGSSSRQPTMLDYN